MQSDYSSDMRSEEPAPSLSHLWQIVKDSESNAKLILPDLLTNPFYLPPPKATKEMQDKKFEKEISRLNYICELESKNVRPTNRKAVLASIPKFKLIGKER